MTNFKITISEEISTTYRDKEPWAVIELVGAFNEKRLRELVSAEEMSDFHARYIPEFKSALAKLLMYKALKRSVGKDSGC